MKGKKYIMQARQNALNNWLKLQLNHQSFTLEPLTGDASFRRYFRLTLPSTTAIVMDAPPNKEPLKHFIQIQRILAAQGLLTPVVQAADIEQGFALIDDLGDALFLQSLTEGNRDNYYENAIETLIDLQHSPSDSLPKFDQQHMLNEMNLFIEWFLKAYLNLSLTASEESIIRDTFNVIAERVAAQPQVFIHRDYHSRNLMLVGEQIGVIDFQDAMLGPVTYDLVSLLKDCYIKLPDAAYQRYVDLFYQRQSLVHHWTPHDFIDEIDYCGLQRHLKVLGVFCRLYLRDNKPNYLQDLPLTMNYTLTCLKRHAPLKPLLQWMEARVIPHFMETCPA